MALGGDIEAGRRLVEDDERGPAGERHREGDALLLAPGELVRIPSQQFRRGLEGRLAHDLGDARVGVGHDPGVHPERLPELRADPERGIERGGRVLGHVADLRAARLPQIARAERQQVRPVQQDVPGADLQALAGVPEQGEGEGGLARARLTHQAEHLPSADGKGHVADHVGPGRADTDLQARHFEPGPGPRPRRGGRRAGRRQFPVPHSPASGPRSVTSAASSGLRSTPMATRAMASVKVFVPIVSSAISAAGTSTAHGLIGSPTWFSLIM